MPTWPTSTNTIWFNQNPGDNYQLGSNPDPDAWLTELQQSTLKLHVQTRSSHLKMNLERAIDSKLICLNNRQNKTCNLSSLGSYYKGSMSINNLSDDSSDYGGSLKVRQSRVIRSTSQGTDTQPLFPSESSSSSLSVLRSVDVSSRSDSMESVYHDAADVFETSHQSTGTDSVKICDTVPIASKFIDILHYSMSKNANCGDSAISFLARMMLGKTIER